MRTTLSPALRSMLIFSTELVFGPIAQISEAHAMPVSEQKYKHTNCADDGCTATIGLGLELGIQAREPFNLSASRRQVIERVGHGVDSSTQLSGERSDEAPRSVGGR